MMDQLDRNRDALDSLHFVAVYNERWGKGRSIDEAIRNGRKAGGSGKLAVYATFDPDVYVDNFGGVVSHPPHEGSRLVALLNGATSASASVAVTVKSDGSTF